MKAEPGVPGEDGAGPLEPLFGAAFVFSGEIHLTPTQNGHERPTTTTLVQPEALRRYVEPFLRLLLPRVWRAPPRDQQSPSRIDLPSCLHNVIRANLSPRVNAPAVQVHAQPQHSLTCARSEQEGLVVPSKPAATLDKPLRQNEVVSMLTLRRCCIGAALGLSLLACSPAQAKQLPVKNGGFETGSWGAYGAGSVRYGTANAATGAAYAQFNGGASRGTGPVHPLTGYVGLQLSSPQSGKVVYTLSGSYYFAAGLGSRSLGVRLYASSHYGFTATTPIAVRKAVSPTNVGKYEHFTVHFTPTHSVRGITFLGFGATTTGNNGVIRLDALNHPAPHAPEVDPQAGAPALALALGGLALMSERRRSVRGR